MGFTYQENLRIGYEKALKDFHTFQDDHIANVNIEKLCVIGFHYQSKKTMVVVEAEAFVDDFHSNIGVYW